MRNKLGALAILCAWIATRAVAVLIAPAGPRAGDGLSSANEGGIGVLLRLVGGSEANLTALQLGVDLWLTVAIGLVCLRFGGPLAGWIGATWWALWPSAAVIAALPFYYFWPAPFSVLLVMLWLRRGLGTGWSAPLLAAWVAIRGTALGIVPMVAARARWKGALVVAAVIAAQLAGGRSQMWHDLYIGIGTRPNPYGIVHKDEYAIEVAARHGVDFHSPRYEATLRDEYLAVARANPVLIVRNWISNTLDGLCGWSFVGGARLSWVPVLGVIAALRLRDPVFTMVLAVWCVQCIGLGFFSRPQACYLAETAGLFVVIGSVGLACAWRGHR